MINFEAITLKFGTQHLLNQAGLTVAAGDKVVVRGKSGCGKSSLLLSLAGAVPLAAGTIRLDGTQLTAETAQAIRSRMAFIGQEPLLGAERVLDALMLPFRFKAHRKKQASGKQISDLLARLHLSTDILDKPCNRISGGEKQRIAIARALLLNKTIFLADEITSALDPESKSAVMAELFRPEITLLSISHDPDWISACDRIIEIRDHKLHEEEHES